jgi:hypothetical protein
VTELPPWVEVPAVTGVLPGVVRPTPGVEDPPGAEMLPGVDLPTVVELPEPTEDGGVYGAGVGLIG